ncbi:unnamed protein product [Ilex paraguariensis]|uniref:Uncharacterized protein n=1 Tax=Ilex paraguariensis TaxID=185542 RepID=A0ABC8S3C5_9AQUA
MEKASFRVVLLLVLILTTSGLPFSKAAGTDDGGVVQYKCNILKCGFITCYGQNASCRNGQCHCGPAAAPINKSARKVVVGTKKIPPVKPN